MDQHRLFNVREIKELRMQVSNLLTALIDARHRKPDETAWLIEWPATPDSQARWWHPVNGWTIDANRAARFCRKEDAEGFIAGGKFIGAAVATEHEWMEMPVSSPGYL